jgi:RHS repeat-associated protein
LKYTYDANNANLLKKVLDLSNNPQGFNETADIATGDSDGLTDQTDDYEYDANGNMVKDTNKSITKITYNHLNLPINLLFEGTTNGTISYLYNATGQKLRKKVVDATSLNTTDYLNGFQYTNTTLDFFPHAEGYVKYTPPAGRGSGIYSYVFNYTDHLGNIRVSYGKDPSTNVLKVLEENHYYPFGLKHTNYNSDKLMYVKEFEVYKLVPINTILPTYKYKYNGKELQEELGLNMYDYGARNYDPALGRWMNIDPLAETSRRWTPYNYTYNNPIIFVDPDGMETERFDGVEYNINRGGHWSDAYRDTGSTASSNSNTGIMIPLGPGTKVGQVHIDKDGKFVWDGKNWIDECGSAVMPVTREIEAVIIDNTTTDSQEANVPPLLALATLTLNVSAADAVTPDPSDLLPQKWIATAIVDIAAIAVVSYYGFDSETTSTGHYDSMGKSKKGKTSERQTEVQHGNTGNGKLSGAKKTKHQKRRPGDMGDKKRQKPGWNQQ